MFKVKVTNIVLEEYYQFEAQSEREIRDNITHENSKRSWLECCCIYEIKAVEKCSLNKL